MPSSSRNLEKVGEPPRASSWSLLRLKSSERISEPSRSLLIDGAQVSRTMGLVRKRADLVDEVRLVSHQSKQRGSTGVPTAARAFGDRSTHVLQAHGRHARRKSKTSGEQLIDARRARTLGDTCRLRRILGSS